MNHFAIYLSNATDKKSVIDGILNNTLLIDFVDLSMLKRVLHSTITINQIIDQEYRHDLFPIKTIGNGSVTSMSSGQQSKALLAYLIDQKPDCIILDDLLSNIDADSMQEIVSQLCALSSSTLFVQLFCRHHDLLHFIQSVVSVDEKGAVFKQQDVAHFNIDHQIDTPVEFHFPKGFFDLKHLPINPLVTLKSVSANYDDKKVLNNIDWTISAGEFWQLKGPNGSGKSTLLSMIIGDNPKGYGQNLELFGYKKGSGESIWDIKKQIGYFYPKMTLLFNRDDSVENMIISGLVDSIGLYIKPTDLQKHIARTWLNILGTSFLNKRFFELSTGQQRMVMVVRALVKNPPLLILDEPTVGLDDHHAQLFVELINAVAHHRKIAIIYVSHRQEANLKPHKTLHLVPGENGSTAVVD